MHASCCVMTLKHVSFLHFSSYLTLSSSPGFLFYLQLEVLLTAETPSKMLNKRLIPAKVVIIERTEVAH